MILRLLRRTGATSNIDAVIRRSHSIGLPTNETSLCTDQQPTTAVEVMNMDQACVASPACTNRGCDTGLTFDHPSARVR